MRRATRALGVLSIVALAAAGGPPARAASDGIAVVAIAPPPGPGPALLDLTERLRLRIAELDPGTVGIAELRARTASPGPTPELPALERGFDQARRAYLQGDFEGSLRMLREVADALERLPDGAEVLALWTKVVMRLARTELDLGHPDLARASLERLLRAVPDLTVDPSLVSPRLAEEIERAGAALRLLPSGTLTVTSSVPGAHVWLNGREIGAAPVRLDLPRGRWRVSGATGTSRVRPVGVDVGDGPREVLLDFSIPELLRPWAGQGLSAGPEDRFGVLLGVGDYLALGRVVAVAVVEGGGSAYVVASLYDVTGRVLEREGRLRLGAGAMPPGGDAALAEFIVRGRTDSPLVQVPGGRIVASPSLAAPEPPQAMIIATPAPSPAARQALRWSPVVTAVAGVAFTTVAVLQLRSAEDSYDRARRLRASEGLTTASSVATYNGLVTDGDAAKGRAGLYWVGAGLSVAATAGLGFLGYWRTGEFGPLRF